MATDAKTADAKGGEAQEGSLPQPTFTRRQSKVRKGEGLWLMSFSDMSLILMSFFVLQLAYSTPDRRKYDNLQAAIKQSTPGAKPIDNLKTLATKIQGVIKAKDLEKVATVTYDVNGLAIEFKDQSLFGAGSAEPNPAYARYVDEVMKAIAKAPAGYKLVIEGHTDDVPISSGRFRSNWELSAARGIALLNGFKARGVKEDRLSVQAYAQTRPRVPVAGLAGEELKAARAANRRVVIRLQ